MLKHSFGRKSAQKNFVNYFSFILFQTIQKQNRIKIEPAKRAYFHKHWISSYYQSKNKFEFLKSTFRENKGEK